MVEEVARRRRGINMIPPVYSCGTLSRCSWTFGISNKQRHQALFWSLLKGVPEGVKQRFLSHTRQFLLFDPYGLHGDEK